MVFRSGRNTTRRAVPDARRGPVPWVSPASAPRPWAGPRELQPPKEPAPTRPRQPAADGHGARCGGGSDAVATPDYWCHRPENRRRRRPSVHDPGRTRSRRSRDHQQAAASSATRPRSTVIPAIARDGDKRAVFCAETAHECSETAHLRATICLIWTLGHATVVHEYR